MIHPQVNEVPGLIVAGCQTGSVKSVTETWPPPTIPPLVPCKYVASEKCQLPATFSARRWAVMLLASYQLTLVKFWLTIPFPAGSWVQIAKFWSQRG